MLRLIRRDVALVALGTALGHGAVICLTPILARWYSPADYGVLALITTFCNLGLVAACLRFDLALPSARPEFARPTFIICILSAVVLASLLFGGSALFLVMDTAKTLPSYAPAILACGVLFTGGHQAVIGWATRTNNFANLAFIRFTQGASFAGLALLPSIGLAWSYVLSFLLAALASTKWPRREASVEASLINVARAEWRFPLLNLPGALIDVVGYSLCVWIITAQYGAAEAGQYAQVQRLIGAPLMLFSMSVAPIVLKYSADARDDPSKLQNIFSGVLRFLVLLGGLAVIFTAALGEPLLGWFLGNQWRVDTTFIVPIAVAVTVRACISPLSNILIAHRRFSLILRWQMGYFLSALIVFTASSQYLDFATFVVVYAMHEAIQYGIYLAMIRRTVRS